MNGINLIPISFWEQIGKPKLKKSWLKLRQFDGSFIQSLGCFEGTFETNTRFEIIPITVVK